MKYVLYFNICRWFEAWNWGTIVQTTRLHNNKACKKEAEYGVNYIWVKTHNTISEGRVTDSGYKQQNDTAQLKNNEVYTCISSKIDSKLS